MKKYIPVFATLVLGLGVLTSQVFFKKSNISASPSKTTNKKHLHYENSFKQAVLKKNDSSYKLTDSKAPITILNFWASWCTPCLEEFPSMNALRAKYNDSQVQIIAINTDEERSIKDAHKIIKKMNLKFENIFDRDDKLIDQFKVSAIPISLIFFKGKVVEVSNGKKDFMAGEFIETLDGFLAGKAAKEN